MNIEWHFHKEESTWHTTSPKRSLSCIVNKNKDGLWVWSIYVSCGVGFRSVIYSDDAAPAMTNCEEIIEALDL